ncbi:hypothetical protein E2C01_079216 [Portunus trituberculatus]|uniref:Uncharacterized protein n=1 Tax=Portunus trituberculatus TaxID=210409 RepID=A0A5B7IUZ5_PORTR|nr:hypothetical protein [Portunus trituberculatus]
MGRLGRGEAGRGRVGRGGEGVLGFPLALETVTIVRVAGMFPTTLSLPSRGRHATPAWETITPGEPSVRRRRPPGRHKGGERRRGGDPSSHTRCIMSSQFARKDNDIHKNSGTSLPSFSSSESVTHTQEGRPPHTSHIASHSAQ